MDIVNLVEEIKEKISDNQYKLLLEYTMKLVNENKGMSRFREYLVNKYYCLNDDYIRLSKEFLFLYIEREHGTDSLHTFPHEFAFLSTNIDREYQEFIRTYPDD
jgi:hypothetical protein